MNVDSSSLAFWELKKKELFSMIRQLGYPQIYLTVSAAEHLWKECIIMAEESQNKRIITEKDYDELDWKYKKELIQKDPVTFARYNDHRVHELFRFLKCKNGVFENYDFLDFYYRVEIQHRDSPHIHALIWLKNAPQFDYKNKESIKECETFIDKFMTCYNDTKIKDSIKMRTHKCLQK